VEIVRKKPGQRTFEVLPRRWVVERTLAWITRSRRLAWDYERTLVHSEAMVMWAMIGLVARRPMTQPLASGLAGLGGEGVQDDAALEGADDG